MTIRMLSALLLTLFIAIGVFAQSPAGSAVTPEMRAEANGFYQKQDWPNAVSAYEKIVKAEEANLSAHYRLGLSLLGLNKNAEAQPHLEKAFTASPNPFFAIALARVYARTGEKEKAYEVLDKTPAMGGIAAESLEAEADFASFRQEPRFKELVQKSDLAVNPCKASPNFRQFDFWIGEWDAKNVQGVTVGSSSIQLILGQCVIFENWSTPVSSGKSFNIFDTRDNKWHQNWVDDKGTYTHYVGELKDGKMVYIAKVPAKGRTVLARMTFSKLPNGDVRQLGESSADDGKTWTTTFDFTYVKKKS
jgi:Tetratricopeptide repeat